VLHISTTGMLVTNNQTVKITLVIPALEELTQIGSGDSTVRGFSGPVMTLNLIGSGDVDFKSQYQRLVVQSRGSGTAHIETAGTKQVEVNAGGSGDIDLIGKTDSFHAVLTGSAGVDAERLIASSAEGIVHGSGDLKVYASKELTLVATAHGDVDVYGNPEVRHVTKTGSGDITFN